MTTGFTSLDAQHAELDALCGAIEAAFTAGDWGAVEIRSALLEQAMRAHFAAEESILFKAGYPELEAHKQAHDWLIKDLGKLRATPERYLTFGATIARHLSASDKPWIDWLERQAVV